MNNIKNKVKIVKGFTPRIRSRHPSHNVLRGRLPRMPFRSIVRLGSTTEDGDCLVCCNTPQAVRNSASKLFMKRCFDQANVRTADWFKTGSLRQWCSERYPIIAKHIYGSRGTGNYKINTDAELKTFMNNHVDATNHYIFEKYLTYLREYRLHVTSEGCFYTCRKMLKRDTPKDKRFQRHDDNCVWIVEDNPDFDKPVNWANIVTDCVNALNSLGLDICAFDVKVQSAKDGDGHKNPHPDWIILESGSAPSFGDITVQKYIEEIPKVLLRKHNQHR